MKKILVVPFIARGVIRSQIPTRPHHPPPRPRTPFVGEQLPVAAFGATARLARLRKGTLTALVEWEAWVSAPPSRTRHSGNARFGDLVSGRAYRANLGAYLRGSSLPPFPANWPRPPELGRWSMLLASSPLFERATYVSYVSPARNHAKNRALCGRVRRGRMGCSRGSEQACSLLPVSEGGGLMGQGF